jgi:hypothetical protein
MTYRNLTDEEISALRYYSETNGRSWKAALLQEWIRGSNDPVLQALRNSHGPTWLTKLRLPN